MKRTSVFILTLLFLVLQAAAFTTLRASQITSPQQEKNSNQSQQGQKSGPPKKKSKAPAPLRVTWDQFINDYEPSIRRNEGPLLRPERLVKRYENKRVQWSGILKNFTSGEKGASALIAMKPRKITVKPLFVFEDKFTVSIAYLLAAVDDTQIEKWKSLSPGQTIRFRVTLDGYGILLPLDMIRAAAPDELPDDVEVKALIVQDAQLVGRK